jgi:thioesterase domain-containing protein
VPLVLIHAAGGTTYGYRPVAQGVRSPVFGIDSPALTPGRPITRDLRELASQYGCAILERFPSRPIAVGGHSFGGAVAIEVARWLKSNGCEVLGVLMLDTPAAGEIPAHLHPLHVFAYILGLPVSQLDRVPTESGCEAFQYLQAWLKTRGLNEDFPLPELQQIFEVCVACASALERWPAHAIDIPLSFFAAEERDAAFRQPLGEAWRHIAKSGFRIEVVPGSHLSMLTHVHATNLAAQIQKTIAGWQAARAV